MFGRRPKCIVFFSSILTEEFSTGRSHDFGTTFLLDRSLLFIITEILPEHDSGTKENGGVAFTTTHWSVCVNRSR